MKKLILIFALLIPVLSFAQLDDEDAQFFGITRSVYYKSFNFNKVTSPVEHVFYIDNQSSVPMTVIGFKTDEGVGVVLNDKNIPPKSKGKFTVIINPKYFKEKGDFSKQITVIVQQKQASGIIEKREIPYIVKGKL